MNTTMSMLPMKMRLMKMTSTGQGTTPIILMAITGTRKITLAADLIIIKSVLQAEISWQQILGLLQKKGQIIL